MNLSGGAVAAPGDLDSSFGTGGRVNIHVGPAIADEWAHSVVVQPDGKILLGGYVNTGHGVVRYNANGTLDAGFGAGGKVISNIGYDSPSALAIQSDGKILLAGSTSFSAGPFRFSVMRCNPNGSRDASFGGTGYVIASFGGAGDFASEMVVQPDGRIVLGGYSQGSAAQNYDQSFALVRFNPDGSLDPAFSDDGKLTTDLGDRIDRCSSLALQSDGKIVAAGYSGASWVVVRYNRNGSLDPSFDQDGKLVLPPGPSISAPGAVAVQADGKILLAGTLESRFALLRINPNGDLDGTFGTNGKVLVQAGSRGSGCSSLQLQPDGKILAGGAAGNVTIDFAIARLNSDGTLDATFGRNGIVTTGAGANASEIHDLALQRDGKILAVGRVWNGTYSDFGVVRYEGDQSPFITLQPQSQLVTAGATLSFTVEAAGASPLFYQWRFEGTNIMGATGTTLTITNVEVANAGTYSVLVSNYLGSVASSNAVLRVNRPPDADASATRLLVVSVNHSNAAAVLDGTRSSDPDGEPLSYAWFTTGEGTPLATGVVAVVTLPRGSNSITLEVNDGLATSTDSIIVHVVAPAEALRRLFAEVAQSNLSHGRKLPLLVHLRLAEQFFERGDPVAAVRQLERFQQKVGIAVEPQAPDLANQWIAEAQIIIDAVTIGLGGRAALSQPPGLVSQTEVSTNLRHPPTAWLESGSAASEAAGLTRKQEDRRAGARTALAAADPDRSQALEAAAQTAIEDRHLNRGGLRLAVAPGSKRVRLEFAVSLGAPYWIEASTNLRDWEKIGVAVQNGQGAFEYEDPNSDQFARRFYRLVRP